MQSKNRLKTINEELDRVTLKFSMASMKLEYALRKSDPIVLQKYERIEYPWSRREKSKKGNELPNLKAIFPTSLKQPFDALQFTLPPESSDKFRKIEDSLNSKFNDNQNSKINFKSASRTNKPKSATISKIVTPKRLYKLKKIVNTKKILKPEELNASIRRLSSIPKKSENVSKQEVTNPVCRPKSEGSTRFLDRIINTTDKSMKTKKENEKMVLVLIALF